ncbi:MAG: DUF3048 domain-containing protein [Patescibacteria group bacterium]
MNNFLKMIKKKSFLKKQINSKTSIYLVFFLFFVACGLILVEHLTYSLEWQGKLAHNYKICDFKNKLTGLCVELEQDENVWPVALMIDNNPDAWPQFGLSKADLVYSTLVEGGATRLMAVFTSGEIAKIGPIRSARPYYLTWAKETDALYGHSGGSIESIQKIAEYKVLNLEEATSYGPNYFWRDNTGGYFAPHNLFTSSSRLQKAREDFDLTGQNLIFSNWFFDNNFTIGQSIANEISIDYSPGVLFDVFYKYSTSSETYLRFQNVAPHIDGLYNSHVETVNLIIQFVAIEKHLDAEDRLRIETTGNGIAFVFIDGKKITGVWQKDSVETRTKFYTESGENIIFKPGNVWIEIVPGDREVLIRN